MTDRLSGFIVTLERDIREDDAEAIVNAIGMLRGVSNVEPIKADYHTRMAVHQAKDELRKKILDLILER
jgi:hypothetical protein